MESHELIPDVIFNLVDSFYTLIDIKSNSDDDSTNKHEINYTSENCLHKLFTLLDGYSNYINSSHYQDIKVDCGKLSHTFSINPDYKFVFKDARDRLPEGEYGFRLDKPVYNGILILLQYLSPVDFTWHYHKNEGNLLRFCCDFGSTCSKDVLTHYYLVSVLKAVNINEIEDECQPLKFADLPKYSDVVLRKINGIVSIIHLPLKNNYKFESSRDGCSYDNPIYVNMDLYNKANSHYSLFPTQCKLSVLGSKLICNCYIVLLRKVPNGQLKCYNLLISTLLLIYNSTHGLVLDEFYGVIITIVNYHPDAFLENSNVLLFREAINKVSDDINNYNNSVEKCAECFIKLSSVVFDDNDVKIYELLESVIDKVKLMNNKRLKVIFMEMYYEYLIRTPLACAATMLQMMELTLGEVDALDVESIQSSLKCLENVFVCLPKDAVYYFNDVYSRFIIIYFVFFKGGDKTKDSLENILKLEFFNKLTVKVCIYLEDKVEKNLENRYLNRKNKKICREEVMNSMAKIIKTAKNTLEEPVFKSITHKIKCELSSDAETNDHTQNELNQFNKMFDL